MTKRNWNKEIPNSITEAMRLCKEHGIEKHGMSVERLADFMGTTVDTLYKWLGNGRMPTNQVMQYEHLTGKPFISQYLAHSQNYLLVKMPSGRQAEHKEVVQLNIFMQQVVSELLSFYSNELAAEQVLGSIKTLMQDLAHQQKNIAQYKQPSLAL